MAPRAVVAFDVAARSHRQVDAPVIFVVAAKTGVPLNRLPRLACCNHVSSFLQSSLNSGCFQILSRYAADVKTKKTDTVIWGKRQKSAGWQLIFQEES
jgi:hypothetical protein